MEYIKSKFRGPEPYRSGKNQALTGAEIWKMWKSHPGLFSAEIFKYVRRKGDSKSGFWGQNPKIWNSLGPKWICMGSPCLFKLSWGPGGPMGGILDPNGPKIPKKSPNIPRNIPIWGLLLYRAIMESLADPLRRCESYGAVGSRA